MLWRSKGNYWCMFGTLVNESLNPHMWFGVLLQIHGHYDYFGKD